MLGSRDAVLERAIREGLSQEVSLKWLSEGSESAKIWGKTVPDRGNSKQKGPRLSEEEQGGRCAWGRGSKGSGGGPTPWHPRLGLTEAEKGPGRAVIMSRPLLSGLRLWQCQGGGRDQTGASCNNPDQRWQWPGGGRPRSDLDVL